MDKKDTKVNLKQEKKASAETEELKKYTELKNQYLYLKAELENYKRNAEKERLHILKYSGKNLVLQILEVLDLLENALQTDINEKNYKSFYSGVKMIHSQLIKTLNSHGVTSISSETGTLFNPEFHEALGEEESETVPEGRILKNLKKAFKFHEQLIRPAHVITSKGKTKK